MAKPKKPTLALVLSEIRELRARVERLANEGSPWSRVEPSFWGGAPIYTGLGFDRPTALDYGPFMLDGRVPVSVRYDGSQLVATSRNSMGRWGWACGCAGGERNGKRTQDRWCGDRATCVGGVGMKPKAKPKRGGG